MSNNSLQQKKEYINNQILKCFQNNKTLEQSKNLLENTRIKVNETIILILNLLKSKYIKNNSEYEFINKLYNDLTNEKEVDLHFIKLELQNNVFNAFTNNLYALSSTYHIEIKPVFQLIDTINNIDYDKFMEMIEEKILIMFPNYEDDKIELLKNNLESWKDFYENSLQDNNNIFDPNQYDKFLYQHIFLKSYFKVLNSNVLFKFDEYVILHLIHYYEKKYDQNNIDALLLLQLFKKFYDLDVTKLWDFATINCIIQYIVKNISYLLMEGNEIYENLIINIIDRYYKIYVKNKYIIINAANNEFISDYLIIKNLTMLECLYDNKHFFASIFKIKVDNNIYYYLIPDENIDVNNGDIKIKTDYHESYKNLTIEKISTESIITEDNFLFIMELYCFLNLFCINRDTFAIFDIKK